MEATATQRKSLFLKPAEAAVELRCCKSKIYDLINTGEIPSLVIGGMLRVPREAIEQMARCAVEQGGSRDAR